MLQCCSIDRAVAGYKGERGRFVPAQVRVHERLIFGPLDSCERRTLFSTRGHLVRVAIYARISTDDRGQDPENQLGELRAWCANAGHTVAREFVDCESGRKGADKRKQFAEMFDDAAKRKFDCVLFWALDRFSREGMVQTIIHLQRLSCYGVVFHSYTEPHLATDNELVRNILLALLSSLAKVEAQKISDRTRAGMARAKAKGIRVGRPKLGLELRQKIAQRAAKGDTPYAIAKALRIDRHTAAKYAGLRDYSRPSA
jgi:DNA invertase Pin-like site-specific DNA recombinase